jgi:hypothetical protein
MKTRTNGGKRKQLAFDIDPKLHRKLKLYALRHDTNIKHLLLTYIEALVSPPDSLQAMWARDGGGLGLGDK